MLARAFINDPFAAMLASDLSRREAASRWTFAAFARYGLTFGEVWTAGDLDGAAIWWAPEYVDLNEERAVLVGLGDGPHVLGTEAWERFLAFAAFTGEIHHRSVAGPHWYLNVLGVAPERQGMGLGSMLLSSMFDRLDRERLPAYLDTGTAENVAYYERRGFVLTAEVHEPASGILTRGMRRDPR